MKVKFEKMFLTRVNSSSILEIILIEYIISLSEMAEPDALSTTRRSLLWDTYFEKLKDEGKCVTCKKVLQCKGGNTVGLSRHLKSAHKKEWAEYEAVVARRDEEKLKRSLSISKSMSPPKRRKEDFFKNHEGEDVAASDKFHKSLVKTSLPLMHRLGSLE